MSEYEQMKRTIQVHRGVSYWLKAAVIALEARDPVDALADAEQLAEVQRARLQGIVNNRKGAKL